MTLRPPWKGYSYAVQFSVLLEGVEWESEQKVCFFWISVCSSVKEHSHGDLSGDWALEMTYKPCAYSKCLIDNPVTTCAGCPSSNMHHFLWWKILKFEWILVLKRRRLEHAFKQPPHQRVHQWTHAVTSGRMWGMRMQDLLSFMSVGVMQTGVCHRMSLQNWMLPERNAWACSLS